MRMPSSRPATALPAPAFIGFVFSLAGWGLIETWLLPMHVKPGAHLLPSLMALYLAFASLRRSRPAQLFFSARDGFAPSGSGGGRALRAGSALVPLAAGGMIGVLILNSSAVPLGLAAACCACAPWSRLPFCRDHVLAASAVMCAGIALPLLAAHRPPSPMFLLIAAWVLWLCAALAVLRRIAGLWRAERSLAQP